MLQVLEGHSLSHMLERKLGMVHGVLQRVDVVVRVLELGLGADAV